MTRRNIIYTIIALLFIIGATPSLTQHIMASELLSLDTLYVAAPDEEEEEDEEGDDEDEEEEDEEDEEEDSEDEEEDSDEEGEDEEGEDEEELENDSIPVGIDEESEILVRDNNGREEIIEIPEGLIIDAEEQMQSYDNRTYLTGDSACILQSTNPLFENEIYIDRLKRMPTAIEMPWNEVVQKFIDRYTGHLRRSVSIMLGKSNFYMPTFEEALEVYGIPLELKYLPVIESALNPNAVSHVGAGGLWQFMVATGKRYGLTVNSMIDERRDLVKSSYAAAHYLSDLYEMFGDWNIVIAAYNCGPGNINKAIQRAGGVKDYWKIYPYLPAETRGYVPAFIAANYVMNYYCEHNICPMETTLPEKSDTIMLYRNVHFEQISHVLGIDIEKLRMLNPQYRRDIITGYSQPTDLRLPQEYISKYIEMEDSILAYNVDELMKRDMVEVSNAPAYTAKRSTYSKAKRTKASKKTSASKKSNKKKKTSASKKKTSSKKKKSSASNKKTPAKKKSSASKKKTTSKKKAPAKKSSKKRKR